MDSVESQGDSQRIVLWVVFFSDFLGPNMKTNWSSIFGDSIFMMFMILSIILIVL